MPSVRIARDGKCAASFCDKVCSFEKVLILQALGTENWKHKERGTRERIELAWPGPNLRDLSSRGHPHWRIMLAGLYKPRWTIFER